MQAIYETDRLSHAETQKTANRMNNEKWQTWEHKIFKLIN